MDNQSKSPFENRYISAIQKELHHPLAGAPGPALPSPDTHGPQTPGQPPLGLSAQQNNSSHGALLSPSERPWLTALREQIT